MKIIDPSGQPVKLKSKIRKLTPKQDLIVVSLDGAWRAGNTMYFVSRSMDPLIAMGLVEKAWREPSPAYPKSMWWYRLTDKGKAEKQRAKARYKHKEHIERLRQGLPSVWKP